MIDLWYFLFVKIVHFYRYKISKKQCFSEFVFPKKKAMYQNNNSNFLYYKINENITIVYHKFELIYIY